MYILASFVKDEVTIGAWVHLWAFYPVPLMWHIYIYTHTMEYYSAIKRNEIELFVVRWMDLEPVIQSEVSQKEKNKYHMLMHIYMESKQTVLMNLVARQE